MLSADFGLTTTDTLRKVVFTSRCRFVEQVRRTFALMNMHAAIHSALK